MMSTRRWTPKSDSDFQLEVPAKTLRLKQAFLLGLQYLMSVHRDKDRRRRGSIICMYVCVYASWSDQVKPHAPFACHGRTDR